MSTNPNNAVGTNGAFGGRTSVNAFNDVLGVFKSRGIVSGWGIVPDSGMDVAVGGDGSTRDVAIAEDNIGNKTTVNNISQQPVTVSIPAAPASNSRIDLIVAYVDNPAQGVATETDNYGACGLIVVSGASAANPVAPNESDIRTAITTDGGAGSVAYYVVLGSVTVASGTTDISSNMISAGAFAAVKSDNVDFVAIAPNYSSVITTFPDQSSSAGSGTTDTVIVIPQSGFLRARFTVGGTGCVSQIMPSGIYVPIAGVISASFSQIVSTIPVVKGQRLLFRTTASSSQSSSISNITLFDSRA